jgi:hypothetical protein
LFQLWGWGKDFLYVPFVVGLALRAELSNEETPSKVRLGIIGISRPVDERVFILPQKYTGHSVHGQPKALETDDEEDDEGKDFLLVVSPCYDQMPASKQTKLFVLLKPKEGLCSMHSIPGSDVFYFSEFRDDSTSSANRQQNWNALVMAQAIQKGKDASEKRKPIVHSNRVDVSVSPVNPTRAFIGQLHVLAAAFQGKREEWLLKNVKEVAAKATHLFPLASERPHTDMFLKADRKIIEDRESNNMEVDDSDEDMDRPSWDAEKMMGEMKAMWPETARLVSTTMLERLHQGIKNDTKNKTTRQQNWNALVMAQAVQKGNSCYCCPSAPPVP